MLKHFEWTENTGNGEDWGRIAASCGQRLVIKQIAGKAPPAAVLPEVIGGLGKEMVSAMVDAHYGRQNRYAVEVRDGMSGCRDYLVREERDSALKDHPIRGGVHVSMYGKLNENIDVWAGDAVPIIVEMIGRNEFVDSAEIYVEEVEVRDFDFRRPGLTLSIFGDGRVGIDRPLEEDFMDATGYGDPSHLYEEALEKLRQIRFEDEDSDT